MGAARWIPTADSGPQLDGDRHRFDYLADCHGYLRVRMSQSPPSRRPINDEPRIRKQWSGDRRNYDTHGQTTNERGYGKDWQALVEDVRARHPLCIDCENRGRTKPMDECHHVVPIKDAPERRLDLTNVAPLCRACHEHWEACGPPEWWEWWAVTYGAG